MSQEWSKETKDFDEQFVEQWPSLEMTRSNRYEKESQKQNLFLPFMKNTNKYENVSSGLGLSIVKELVELFNTNIVK